MRRPSGWALAISVLLLGTACLSKTAKLPTAGPPTTRDGGTISVAAEQFPTVLNTKLPPNLAWTGRTAGVALARGYLITPDFTYRPWLFDGDCKVSPTPSFVVSCSIARDARWSDGTDLTADDFKFTLDTILDPKNRIVSREGYNKISQLVVKSPKAFDMVFVQPFAPWRGLWAGPFAGTLPKHVLEGQDFNTVWNSCICVPGTGKPIGSGPFLVTSFTPGSGPLILSRNEAYWAKRPALDSIVFKPILDTDAEVSAFREGAVDVIFPQTQVGLAEKIHAVPDANYESALGTSWEHLDMRTDVPGLDDVEVRRAIATALPRQQLVDTLAKPADGRAQVLDNAVYMVNQSQYRQHWNLYPAAGDVALASGILDRAGYVRGADGIYAKAGVRLDFTITVISGNRTRELSEQIVQEQLKRIGVNLTIQNSADSLAKVMALDYQMTIFSWTGGPDPGGQTVWREDGIPTKENPTGQNVTKIRLPAVTDLFKRGDAEVVDDGVRADLYNRADDLLSREGISSIPLFQRPQPLAYRDTLVGLKDNPTSDSFVWNIEEWALRA